jgi:branched-chain amino acid transport system permease protein
MESVLAGCVTVGIQLILVLSINIVSGYARQLVLGQAAFAALGAYTSALLSLRLGWSFWAACPSSLVVAGGVGFLLGLPCLRMPKYYLSVMTLVANALVQHLLRNGRFAGGYFGLGHIPAPQFFNSVLESAAYLPLVLVALAGCVMVDRWFWHTHFGQALRLVSTEEAAIRSPEAARATVVAFVISTMMAGLAGSLFAHFEAFISPFDFGLDTSLFLLAMAACGGLGSPVGAVAGGLLLGGLVESVRSLVVYRLLLSGVVLLLVGLWFPRGLLTAGGFFGFRVPLVSPEQSPECSLSADSVPPHA